MERQTYRFARSAQGQGHRHKCRRNSERRRKRSYPQRPVALRTFSMPLDRALDIRGLETAALRPARAVLLESAPPLLLNVPPQGLAKEFAPSPAFAPGSALGGTEQVRRQRKRKYSCGPHRRAPGVILSSNGPPHIVTGKRHGVKSPRRRAPDGFNMAQIIPLDRGMEGTVSASVARSFTFVKIRRQGSPDFWLPESEFGLLTPRSCYISARRAGGQIWSGRNPFAT